MLKALTVSQAVRYAAQRGIILTPEELRNAIASGQLKPTRVYHTKVVSSDLDAWLDTRTTGEQQ